MKIKSISPFRFLSLSLSIILLLLLFYSNGLADYWEYETSTDVLILRAYRADKRNDPLAALINYKAYYYRGPDDLEDNYYRKEVEERMADLQSTLYDKIYIANVVIRHLEVCNKYPCDGYEVTNDVKQAAGLPIAGVRGPASANYTSAVVPPNSIMIFEDENYGGWSRIYTLEDQEEYLHVQSLGRFNNQISSIAIGRNVEVWLYDPDDYQSPYIYLTSDYQDLNFTFYQSNTIVNDHVSSLIIGRK